MVRPQPDRPGAGVTRPKKPPAGLTIGAFRPIVESLDLTPAEAGAIRPVPKGEMSTRTQVFFVGSVIAHFIGIAALIAFSTASPQGGVEEIPLSIVIAPFDEDARRRGSGRESGHAVEAPAPASVVADNAPPDPYPRPQP